MVIIKKRADELQPGDILVYNRDAAMGLMEARRFEVLRVTSHDCATGSPQYEITQRSVDGTHPPSRFTRGGDVNFQVEVPDVSRETMLTPAQQHADGLLALAKRCAAALAGTPDALSYDETALLDKIDPAPPTLADTLVALDNFCRAVSPHDVDRDVLGAVARVLGQARRHGLLPNVSRETS